MKVWGVARPLVPPRHIQVQVRPEAPALDGAPAFLLVCGEGTGVAAPLSRCGFGCGQGRRICISKFTKCSGPLGSDPSPKLQAWLQVESGGGETWTHLQETTLPPLPTPGSESAQSVMQPEQRFKEGWSQRPTQHPRQPLHPRLPKNTAGAPVVQGPKLEAPCPEKKETPGPLASARLF